MADREDFATAVGALIKGRSPVGHTHGIGQVAGLSDALTGVSTSAKTYVDEQLAAQRAGWAIEQSAFDDGLYVIVDGGQLTPASTGLYKIGA